MLKNLSVRICLGVISFCTIGGIMFFIKNIQIQFSDYTNSYSSGNILTLAIESTFALQQLY